MTIASQKDRATHATVASAEGTSVAKIQREVVAYSGRGWWGFNPPHDLNGEFFSPFRAPVILCIVATLQRTIVDHNNIMRLTLITCDVRRTGIT